MKIVEWKDTSHHVLPDSFGQITKNTSNIHNRIQQCHNYFMDCFLQKNDCKKNIITTQSYLYGLGYTCVHVQ